MNSERVFQSLDDLIKLINCFENDLDLPFIIHHSHQLTSNLDNFSTIIFPNSLNSSLFVGLNKSMEFFTSSELATTPTKKP